MNQLQQQLSLTTSEAIDLRNELTRTKDEYDEVWYRRLHQRGSGTIKGLLRDH
jgi:hypothetical protein